MIIYEVNDMKKIAMIFLLLLTVTACSSSYLSKLNYKKLMTKLDNKESFVLYLTNEDESGLTLKNTLQTVCKDNNIKCFYLNTDNLDEDELDSLKEKITFEDSNIIVFIKEGKENTVLARIDDVYISAKDLKEELKNQEYLK